MRRALIAAGAALALLGCAAAALAEDAPKRANPITSYSADPFAPVNLYMNSNEQLTGTPAELVEYTAAQLRDSGAFERVDRGVQRWPITLQARYRFEENTAKGDGWRRALGMLSLGLVPVRVSQTHTLFTEVLAEPDSVAVIELSVTVRDRISLYDLGDPTRDERAAADTLLEQLLAEIAQRRLVPRWASFRPEPKKKPEVEPVGQPT
ncbi:MAG: hypothetical protein ACT4PK_02385 [Gammaproteobacteria bacterium]